MQAIEKRLSQQANLQNHWRHRVVSRTVDWGFRSLSNLVRLHPRLQPKAHNVAVVQNIPYIEGSQDQAHLLDIYVPSDVEGPKPVIFYVHGGGFRILSKDTHWAFGMMFARKGFVVVNINYRLAPTNPYPAAIEDTCHAYAWLSKHYQDYDIDPTRVVLAGESAGANLVSSLALMRCFDAPLLGQGQGTPVEPWVQAARDASLHPSIVLPACGIFQVSDPARFPRRKPKMPKWLRDQIYKVCLSYLPGGQKQEQFCDWADPLLVAESFAQNAAVPVRPLPSFFFSVGTRDILIDDTRRMHQAMHTLGADSVSKIYPGGVHAFHAFLWQKRARVCWEDHFSFLRERVTAAKL